MVGGIHLAAFLLLGVGWCTLGWAQEPASPLPPVEGTGLSPVAPLKEEIIPPVSEERLETGGPVSPKFSVEIQHVVLDLSRPGYGARAWRLLPEGTDLKHLTGDWFQGLRTTQLDLHHLLQLKAYREGRVMKDAWGSLNSHRPGFWKVDFSFSRHPRRYGEGLPPLPYPVPDPLEHQEDWLQGRVQFTPGDRLLLWLEAESRSQKGDRPLAYPIRRIPGSGDLVILERALPTSGTLRSLNLGGRLQDDPFWFQVQTRLGAFDQHLPEVLVFPHPVPGGTGTPVGLSGDYWFQSLEVQSHVILLQRWALQAGARYRQLFGAKIQMSPYQDLFQGTSTQEVVEPDLRGLHLHLKIRGSLRPGWTLQLQWRQGKEDNDTQVLNPFPPYPVLEDPGTFREPSLPRYPSWSRKLWSFRFQIRRGRHLVWVQSEEQWRHRRVRAVSESHQIVWRGGFRSLPTRRGWGEVEGTWIQIQSSTYQTNSVLNPDSFPQHPGMREWDLVPRKTIQFRAAWHPRFREGDLGFQWKGEWTRAQGGDLGLRKWWQETWMGEGQWSPSSRWSLWGQLFLDRARRKVRYTWMALGGGFLPPVTGSLRERQWQAKGGLTWQWGTTTHLEAQLEAMEAVEKGLGLPPYSVRLRALEIQWIRDFYPGFLPPSPWTLTLSYRQERYQREDPYLDGFPEGGPTCGSNGTDCFLGLRDPAYTLHRFMVQLESRF